MLINFRTKNLMFFSSSRIIKILHQMNFQIGFELMRLYGLMNINELTWLVSCVPTLAGTFTLCMFHSIIDLFHVPCDTARGERTKNTRANWVNSINKKRIFWRREKNLNRDALNLIKINWIYFFIRNYIKAQIRRSSYRYPNIISMDKGRRSVQWLHFWWEKQ